MVKHADREILKYVRKYQIVRFFSFIFIPLFIVAVVAVVFVVVVIIIIIIIVI